MGGLCLVAFSLRERFPTACAVGRNLSQLRCSTPKSSKAALPLRRLLRAGSEGPLFHGDQRGNPGRACFSVNECNGDLSPIDRTLGWHALYLLLMNPRYRPLIFIGTAFVLMAPYIGLWCITLCASQQINGLGGSLTPLPSGSLQIFCSSCCWERKCPKVGYPSRSGHTVPRSKHRLFPRTSCFCGACFSFMV